MKKILSILTVFAMMFLINSCRSDGEMAYDGDSLLIFAAPQSSGDVFVLSGSGSTTYDIPFGVLKQSGADSDVTLTVDAANSTAVEGVDFTIPVKTVTLKAGATSGNFVVKLLESGAVQSGKTIAFKLTSGSLTNAAYNQDFMLNVSLTCPISTFLGDFKNTESWFNAPNGIYTVVAGSAANTLVVEDYFGIGFDLNLNYDPTTYVISVPTQSTGEMHPTYGLISARQSTDAALVSSFNPCTRAMTVYVNFFVSAGTFGNKKEAFIGN